MNKISEEFLLPESISFVPVDSILCGATDSGGNEGGQGSTGGGLPGEEEGGDEEGDW